MLDGVPGETRVVPARGADAGRAHGVGPVDRPIRPDETMGQPGDAGPAADAQLPHDARATAASPGRPPRPIDLPHPSASTTGPLIRLPRRRPRAAVRALEGVRRPVGRSAPGAAALLRATAARPGPTRPWSPPTRQTACTSGTSASRCTRNRATRRDVLDVRPRGEPRRPDPHRLGLARRPRVDRPAADHARRPALPAGRARR